MTFLKENGGSLLGQGSFSLDRGADRASVREGSGPSCSSAHGQDPCPPRPRPAHSLLRPHICLRDTDFVHKLSKSNSIVTGELAQDLGWASGKKGRQLGPSSPTGDPVPAQGTEVSLQNQTSCKRCVLSISSQAHSFCSIF